MKELNIEINNKKIWVDLFELFIICSEKNIMGKTLMANIDLVLNIQEVSSTKKFEKLKTIEQKSPICELFDMYLPNIKENNAVHITKNALLINML